MNTGNIYFSTMLNVDVPHKYLGQHCSSLPFISTGVMFSSQIVSDTGHSVFRQLTIPSLQLHSVHLSGCQISPSTWPSLSQTRQFSFGMQESLWNTYSSGQKHPSTRLDAHFGSSELFEVSHVSTQAEWHELYAKPGKYTRVFCYSIWHLLDKSNK